MTRLRTALVASAAALAVATPGLATPSTAAPVAAPAGPVAVVAADLAPAPVLRPSARARTVGRLAVAPRRYVGGQALTWRGNIGRPGVRRVRLQLHISRPGDQWTPVKGFSARTARDGSFRFRFPAPAMSTIRYRVVSGGLATRPVTFDARTQDLTVALVGHDTERRYGRIRPGRQFTLAVDTTPRLQRRPDTRGIPVFPGRRLTLQVRNGDGDWDTVRTSATDRRGNGRFTGLTVGRGTTVYRVRQEDYRKRGNRIGWMASFPYYVYAGVPPHQGGTGRSVSEAGPRAGRATGTASQRYRWNNVNYDFGWLRGESLTSAPQKGTMRRAYWDEWSDGSGRASTRNGGLEIISNRIHNEGPGDFGSTWVTVRKGGQKYGRWELRFRSKVIEAGQRHYRMVAQLVPSGADPGDCTTSITIAEVTRGTRLSFGARSGTDRWRGARKIRDLDHSSPAFAVEVMPTKVTWLMDGRAIGSVRRGVTGGQEMTLRIGLVGSGQAEMNHSGVYSDWVRSWPLTGGRKARGGAPLKQSTGPAC